MKFTTGQARDLGLDRADDPQVGQASPEESAGEGQEPGAVPQILLSGAAAHPLQESELVVLEDVDAVVVGPEVVDLLLVEAGPEVGADELDGVELVLEPGPLPGEALDYAIAHAEAHALEVGQVLLVLGDGLECEIGDMLI